MVFGKTVSASRDPTPACDVGKTRPWHGTAGDRSQLFGSAASSPVCVNGRGAGHDPPSYVGQTSVILRSATVAFRQMVTYNTAVVSCHASLVGGVGTIRKATVRQHRPPTAAGPRRAQRIQCDRPEGPPPARQVHALLQIGGGRLSTRTFVLLGIPDHGARHSRSPPPPRPGTIDGTN